MKGGRWFSKEGHLTSTAGHHHEEEEAGTEEGIQTNKTLQNGFVAPENKKEEMRGWIRWRGRADRDLGD